MKKLLSAEELVLATSELVKSLGADGAVVVVFQHGQHRLVMANGAMSTSDMLSNAHGAIERALHGPPEVSLRDPNAPKERN